MACAMAPNPDTNPDPNPDPKHVPRSYDIGDSDTVGFSIRGTWAAHFPVADPTPNPQPLIGGVYPGNLPHDFDCFVDSKGWTDTALAWGHRTAHTLGAEAYIEAISGIGGITLVETLHSEPFFGTGIVKNAASFNGLDSMPLLYRSGHHPMEHIGAA